MNNPFLPKMWNIQSFASQFQQFKKNFSGNPQQIIQQMLQSGRITQDQFNQAQAMAMELSQYLK